MERVSARNYVIQKRITLSDFGIFWDFSGFFGICGIFWDLKSQKIRFFPLGQVVLAIRTLA
jgi:hypothetical protein